MRQAENLTGVFASRRKHTGRMFRGGRCLHEYFCGGAAGAFGCLPQIISASASPVFSVDKAKGFYYNK